MADEQNENIKKRCVPPIENAEMEKNQMKKKKLSTKTIAMLAMMIAIALVFSYVETLIPINFGISWSSSF